MLQTSSEEFYEDGQIIFEEGSAGDWVYLVESGAVELYRVVDEREKVVAVCREGEVFGEMAFLGNMRRTATARAVGKTCVSVLDRNLLDEEYSRLSDSFRTLLRSLAQRLKQTTDICVGIPKVRREKRVLKSFSIKYKTRRAFVKACTHNVGSKGMFIKTPKPLPKHSRFELKVNVPGYDEPLDLLCEVKWIRTSTDDPKHRPLGMGVEFVDMDDSTRKRLVAAMHA